jgi:hypothetical protein
MPNPIGGMPYRQIAKMKIRVISPSVELNLGEKLRQNHSHFGKNYFCWLVELYFASISGILGNSGVF